MAHVQDGAAAEEHGHGAEHTGFLQKLKDKLHIGRKAKEETVEEEPAHDAAVGSTNVSGRQVSSAPVDKPMDVVAPPAVTSAGAPAEHDARSTGHESEHHGGVPTFLATLPDQDVPAKDAPARPGLHHVEAGDSEHAERHSGVPEDGVPTFLAALPDRDIPSEDAPAHTQLHHGGGAKEAPQGDVHHGVVPEGGVPTFLAALPDQDIPAEDAPAHQELHHVQQQGEHHQGGAPRFDSEQFFDQAQQGDHHHGVPTFLVALPDEEIPAEVTRGVESGTRES